MSKRLRTLIVGGVEVKIAHSTYPTYVSIAIFTSPCPQPNFLVNNPGYIREPENREGIFLLSVPDLIAMKLNANSVSGQRTKDFVDIYYSFRRYSISEMLNFYKVKYSQESIAHVLKSLIYFEDIHKGDWPVLIQEPQLEWGKIKEKIEREVLRFSKF